MNHVATLERIPVVEAPPAPQERAFERALCLESLDWPYLPSVAAQPARAYAYLVAELALLGLDEWR